ncbi:MAG: hypothetical protein IJB66_03320, partial [Oscillospiraceae bacterium]|nr:hypothetical protein [Oscillospiraceae bacterium]
RIIAAPPVGKKYPPILVGVWLALTRKKVGDRMGRPYIILRNHQTSAENPYRIPQSPSVTAPFNKGAFLKKRRIISAPTEIALISADLQQGGGLLPPQFHPIRFSLPYQGRLFLKLQ